MNLGAIYKMVKLHAEQAETDMLLQTWEYLELYTILMIQ
jgi:hypothetical protein